MNTERTFWNKLRILVTNKCNYRCPFCHNEGQEKKGEGNMMSLSDFKRFVQYINNQDISELHFSGGEPFLNPSIVDMIEYVDAKTDWGIGCATNLSKITDEQISRLAKTKVKFNIQFPYANDNMFHQSTGNGDYDHIITQIQKVKEAGIRIGLNAVIQDRNIDSVLELIDFTISHQLPLKLLPQIGLEGSEKFKGVIYPILEKLSVEMKDKGTGATRWVIQKNGMQTVVLYIDSPCFDKDIEECRQFGELRIHPDMSLQPCIFKNAPVHLCLQDGKEKVIDQMTALWNDFKHC